MRLWVRPKTIKRVPATCDEDDEYVALRPKTFVLGTAGHIRLTPANQLVGIGVRTNVNSEEIKFPPRAGFELQTLGSRVRYSNHSTIPLPSRRTLSALISLYKLYRGSDPVV